MPNTAQILTYRDICSGIARLRGSQSYVPLSLDQVTPLDYDGDHAIFCVNGARVFVENSGNVAEREGLPDCPRFAGGLLSNRDRLFLPAIAADLLTRGNPHKRFLANHSHTPESFAAYLQHGTRLGEDTAPCIHQSR